jgi:hypothetical protein
MSNISVTSLVLGSLTVQVDGADSTLALSVLSTAPASLSIELGTPGAQGDAATIAVGTTTTLSPGASATVTNVGTSSAAVFNFGIPAGLKGDTGNTGATGSAATISVGSTSTGAAGSSASVVNSGTSSAAVFDFTIPRGDKGDKGDTGNTGATGSQGPAGTAATATAGTTTTGAAGSSASVTNVGTTSAAVFDFVIPRGDTGATGATGATGPAGPGVPVGGTAGQSLLKVDGTDYNTTWGTPALATAAETITATVRNNTGSTLTAGQVVYISGALGNRPTVALSKADAESTSAGTYGMVSAPIANNADGTIVIAGYVANLDTSGFTDGDKLYLSPTTAGAWTTTKPVAPYHMVYVGVVARAHPTQGVIQLRIQNGYELDELHNVAALTPSDNDLLAYESSTSLWKNKSFTGLGLATQSWVTSQGYLTTAPVTSVAGRTGAITLGVADVSGAAPLASPSLTGTPLSTTAAADTNTTQIATTAFVVGQASTTTPSPDGTAAVGTSLKYARADHVHATDTTRAALAGATFTGKVNTLASAVGGAGLNLPHGTAPTTPTNGDIWTTTAGVYARVNGATQTLGGGGGGGGIDIQVFGSSSTSGTFTWTKPANAKMVYLWMVGGGHGGGSGARYATSSLRGGGGGGAGGNAYARWLSAAFLGATETVTVGTGVQGGASVTTDSTAGIAPTMVTTNFSSFAGFRTYGPAGGGQGGSSTASGTGSSGGNHIVDFGTIANVVGGTGNSGSTGSTPAGGTTYHAGLVAGGGGGGVGQSATLTFSVNGGAGSKHGAYTDVSGAGLVTAVAGGTGGVASTLTAAGNGVDGGFSSSVNTFRAGTGGGGGYYVTGAAGGAGGNGGWPGGGGGGGGASDNGFASGKGGNGANGAVVIITYS